MKVVWALLLLFLSQADTYLGRREPHRGLEFKRSIDRQEQFGTANLDLVYLAGRVPLGDVLPPLKALALSYENC